MTNEVEIIDITTGDVSFREMTVQEKNEAKIVRERLEAEELAIQTELAIKTEAKNALLEKLGITEDEAKLLFS